MNTAQLVTRLARLRLRTTESMSHLAGSSREPDEVTNVRDLHETFLMLGDVSKHLRTVLAFPHEVTKKVVSYDDGSEDHLARCDCGWFDFVSHEYYSTHGSFDEARTFHLDYPHVPGVLPQAEAPEALYYLSGELAAQAVLDEETDRMWWEHGKVRGDQ